jgi:DNA mismatch repair protein MutS
MEDVIFEFENKDINNMTPIEALRFLADIKVKIEEIK